MSNINILNINIYIYIYYIEVSKSKIKKINIIIHILYSILYYIHFVIEVGYILLILLCYSSYYHIPYIIYPLIL
jgi:hypothetical protein